MRKMSSQKSATDFNNKAHTKSQEKIWKVGDKCRCKYSADNLYYEADIIDIIESNKSCIVKYVGYDNEEKVLLQNLVASEGEGARQRQIQQVIIENVIYYYFFFAFIYIASTHVLIFYLQESVEEVEMESDSKSNKDFRQSFLEHKKKNFGKRRDKSKNKKDRVPSDSNNQYFDLPGFSQSPFNGMIPPPPPPCMFSNLTKDDSESEAMNAMLMSWYMSGYHTGYYQGLKSAKKK